MDTETKPQILPVGTHQPESFYERNAVTLQWGIIAVAFFAALGIYWWRSKAAVEAHALGQFAMAQGQEDFADISSTYSETRAASWARLREANGYLDSALKDAFTNREKADTDLEKATNLLEGLKDASGPSELKQQVLFAYARCLEMSSDGKVDSAIEAYEALLKKFPDSPFKREAQERIHALHRPEASEFYAYFSKQHPKPTEQPRPNDEKAGKKKAGTDDPLTPLSGLGGGSKKPIDAGLDNIPLLAPPSLLEKKEIPEEGAALPEVPKPKTPKQDATQKDAGAGEEKPKSTEEKPAAEKKAADDAKPVEKPTANDKPEAKPAATEEKKAESPADSKPADAKKP